MADDSFVPSSKQPSVIYCRLTDFLPSGKGGITEITGFESKECASMKNTPLPLTPTWPGPFPCFADISPYLQKFLIVLSKRNKKRLKCFVKYTANDSITKITTFHCFQCSEDIIEKKRKNKVFVVIFIYRGQKQTIFDPLFINCPHSY